ncbi:oxygenase MpaB family protein [Nocardia farcinica]|uniref:oxygenase MpaB family protein n=1 Tax=Nocardia farcinica TaxID=37329 RepID=UPI002458F374|nr:oxygenase MpaB family protein [Nocardia farcinica]
MSNAPLTDRLWSDKPSSPEPGYFTDDSMIRRVMRKRAVGITYGLRALVVGAVHPLLYVGTAENTHHRTTPYTRLAITGRLFEAVFLGSKAEADRALAYTGKRHVEVKGQLPEDAGPANPAGTHYSALDPELMFWTMAFTMDSAEVMHDILVRELTDGEREGLYQDYVTWGELFGMPRSAAPDSYAGFRKRFDDYIASAEPHLTEEAELVGSYLMGKRIPYPLPAPAQQVSIGYYRLVQGSLPPEIRAMYGLEWGQREQRQFELIARGVRAAHRSPIPVVRPLKRALRGPSAPLYQNAARREAGLQRKGQSSMPGVDPRRWAERHSA